MEENEKIEFPLEWRFPKLQEIANIFYGKGLPTSKFIENGFPVFGANGVIGYYSEYLFEEEKLLISCRGANSGTINVSPKKCYITNNSLIINFPLHELQFKKSIFYALQIADKSKLITGTAQPQVTINNAVELKIPIPPLLEQKEIVSKIEGLFSELDNGIESLKKAQQQLKTYRQAVLKSAFQGKLTKSDIGNWDKTSFKNCLKFSQGIQVDVNFQSNIKHDGQVRFLRIIDFTQGNDPERFIDFPGTKYMVAKEDISLVRYGASTGFVCTGLNGAIANNLFRVIPNEKIYKRFLFYFLKSVFFQQVIAQKIKGAAMPAISFSLINEVEIKIPPTLSEQHAIVSKIETRLSVCDKLEQTIEDSLKKSEALRQSILKKAFEGKLTKAWREENPELISGENSAESLLARIQAEKARLAGEGKKRRSRKAGKK